MFEPDVREVVQAAFARLRTTLDGTSYLGSRVLPWLLQLAHAEQPEAYFEHPFAYPLLELPLWVRSGLGEEADRDFAVNVTLSNLCGYYLIRLLDDAMDSDGQADLPLLGAVTFFQVHLQRPYQRYFGPEHPFWDVFAEICTVTADVTVRDADVGAVTREDFLSVTSRKVCGSKIPVAAACYRSGREDLIPAWFRFIDCLGPPHQMLNDVMGWHKDLKHAHASYLFSEAARRAAPGESSAAWVIREGFDWGFALVEQWVAEASAAVPGDNPAACRFLQARTETLAQVRQSVVPGLEGLQRVLANATRSP